MSKQDLSRLLTIPAASRRLGISTKAVRAAVSRGELQALRLTETGWPRLTEESLRGWIARRRMLS